MSTQDAVKGVIVLLRTAARTIREELPRDQWGDWVQWFEDAVFQGAPREEQKGE